MKTKVKNQFNASCPLVIFVQLIVGFTSILAQKYRAEIECSTMAIRCGLFGGSDAEIASKSILLDERRKEEAIKSYEKALTIDPSASSIAALKRLKGN